MRWEDVVGKLIGMSGRNLRRGMEVYLAALDGDDLASELCAKLDEGELTISGAYKRFKAGGKPSAGESDTADEGPDEALGISLKENPEGSAASETDRKLIEELTQAMKASLPARSPAAGQRPGGADKPLDFAHCMHYAADALRAGEYGTSKFVNIVMREYLRAARTKYGDDGVIGAVIDGGILDERLEGCKISLWMRAEDVMWWDDRFCRLQKDAPIMAHLEAWGGNCAETH